MQVIILLHIDYSAFSLISLQSDDGVWLEDEEQIVRLKANYVISAFGSYLGNEDGELPLTSASTVEQCFKACS